MSAPALAHGHEHEHEHNAVYLPSELSESKVLKIFVVIRDGHDYIDYINYIEFQCYLHDRVFKDQGKCEAVLGDHQRPSRGSDISIKFAPH